MRPSDMLSELEMKRDIVMIFSGCKLYYHIKFKKKIIPKLHLYILAAY